MYPRSQAKWLTKTLTNLSEKRGANTAYISRHYQNWTVMSSLSQRCQLQAQMRWQWTFCLLFLFGQLYMMKTAMEWLGEYAMALRCISDVLLAPSTHDHVTMSWLSWNGPKKLKQDHNCFSKITSMMVQRCFTVYQRRRFHTHSQID